MSTGSSNFSTVRSVVTQNRKGVQKEDTQVNAPVEQPCWNHMATKLKGLENWKERKRFLIKEQIFENSWVYQQVVTSPANPTHSAEETYENSAGGTQELLSVEGSNLAYN